VAALDAAALAVMRGDLLLVLCTEGDRRVDVTQWPAVSPDATWQIVLSTEAPAFVEPRDAEPAANMVIDSHDGLSLQFGRPASLILRRT
jgi:hypothetical protein